MTGMADATAGRKTPRPLYSMFLAVPRTYDLVNHVVTLGQDARWRRRAARECLRQEPERVLDLCCGTGDLALTIAGLDRQRREITGLDYARPMLDLAVSKAATRGEQVSFVCGEAASLPFPDGCFDCVGISFAFRNLTYRNPFISQYLAEVLRVVAPGGRFVIVESSQPASRPVRAIFRMYLRIFVARAGAWLSGNKAAYRYLAESAARFYAPGEINNLLLNAGFRDAAFRQLLFGAAAIHVATK
ncbi:MAG TPA: dimethylmenaquinone methyltransferase [Candidatus Aminicenantes bacterium]|nr:dimethylmenaquinone methyltransferase [Candidatus Aminicenantes bacterium]